MSESGLTSLRPVSNKADALKIDIVHQRIDIARLRLELFSALQVGVGVGLHRTDRDRSPHRPAAACRRVEFWRHHSRPLACTQENSEAVGIPKAHLKPCGDFCSIVEDFDGHLGAFFLACASSHPIAASNLTAMISLIDSAPAIARNLLRDVRVALKTS